MDSCPVGFSQYLANCVVSVNPFFDITFNSLTSEYKDTASNIVFTYSSNITPVMQRGIYFNSMATLSTDSLMFSYNFTIVLYVKIVASGNILAFNGFTISENSGIEIKISGNLLCAFTSLNPQNWMLLKISQWKDIKQLQYSQSINLQEKSTSTDCVSENSIYSAAIDQLSLGSKFFNGFIWKLQIFSSVTDINPPSLIVCATSLEANCVWDCDLNSYLSSDSCEYCDINCETCRRASDCSLCVNELCITCTDYETCGSCASDSSLNDLSVCKCNNGLYWESLENSCKPCYFTCMNCDGPSENDCVCKYGVLVNDICECDKGYFSISNGCKICDERCDQCDGIYYYNCLSCKGYLLDNVCLDYCPMGYITAFHQCELINDGGIALKYQFDSMAKNQTGAYEYLNFFNVISTYQRGICFNHSHLELPHSASPILVFGVKFAIELWINPLNLTSAVFFKNNTFQTIFSVSLSNGYQNIIINIDNEPYEYTSWYPVHQKEWNHILIILDSTKGTTLQTFTNTYSTQAMCIEECFYDDINSFLYVGTDFNTEDYSGFMYSFAIYLKWPQIYQLATLENCDFCSVCNSTLTCTPNCNILAYYNSTILKCVDCRTECTYGCRNGINCSLCIDENCIKCESYGTKSCVECESGYEVIENICVQCNSSSYYNYDLKICKMCEGVCKTCSSKVCKSCGKNSYLTKENICECESGYFINNSDCSRKKFYASASINSKNIIKILFSEDLSSPLKHSEISAKINAISQDFDLEKKNNSTYTLSIIFTKSIEKGDKLKMTFAKPLTSKENSILFTKFLELELFPLPSDTIGAEISNAKSYATAGIMAGVSAALGSSFINIDPSSFFSLLNNIEIFTYFTLYQLEISPTLIGFLNTLNPISLIPNIFTYIISPSQGVSLNDKFINVSVTSNLILLNSGATISILIAFLLIPFCALCIRDTQISGLKYELKKL